MRNSVTPPPAVAVDLVVVEISPKLYTPVFQNWDVNDNKGCEGWIKFVNKSAREAFIEEEEGKGVPSSRLNTNFLGMCTRLL
jgi:hypothetical protein